MRKISQPVLLSTRFYPKSVGVLYQDETKKGTRIRVYLSGKLLGGVIFKNENETCYYFAMMRLSRKIKRPIQYMVCFYPVLPM
ncbi:MAG: hypothetical protein HY864_13365 [Chloroflexi bacterium]|nr:hypothetical protein [Chloroflexota bacterium]